MPKSTPKPASRKTAAKPPAKTPAPAPAPEPKKRRAPDWEAIERDYRLDKWSLRELADKHGTDAATIVRRKAKDQQTDPTRWQKDLRPVVRQATNAILTQELVNKEINAGQQQVNTAVLAAAELGASVIRRHREDLVATREAAMAMLGELNLTTHSADQIQELFEKVTEDISGPTLAAVQQQFRDFMRLHSRIGSVHKLADTLNKLQLLERKAYDLDDEGKGGGAESFEDRVADMQGDIPP